MRYEEFKECVVAAAKERGLADYELYYKESDSMSAGALLHELNSFSTSSSAGACFRCIHGGKMGYASTELLSEEEAVRIVDAAMENAEVIESEDMVFLHEAGDTYAKVEPVKTVEPTAQQMIEKVMALQEKVYAGDARVIDGSESFVDFSRRTIALCNSRGLDLSYTSDKSHIGCDAVVKEGEDMYDSYEVKCGDFAELDIDAIATRAVNDALESVGKESVQSGIYDIVFSNKMMGALLHTFFSIFSAEEAQKGLSKFAGQENTEIASKLLTIVDDPFCEDTLLRMPFDSEGVATYRKNVVENGRLCTLLHNLKTAHKAGVKSTGNGQKGSYASNIDILPYNFYVAAGEAGTREDIFQAVGNGIYVTRLSGMHAGANPVTGDFSLAAEGFLIENGERTRAAKNFTVSGNYYELLKKITLVGSDLRFSTPGISCFGAPTVMVKELSVAGK